MTLERAAALFAVDPAGLGGLLVRGAATPAQEAFLAFTLSLLPEGAPVRRAPISITEDRLLGGLDLAATLRVGRPVASRGVLAEAHGGVLVMPMAERATPGVVARVASTIDTGVVPVVADKGAGGEPARFGVIALDESIEDERVHAALTDRLGVHVACERFESHTQAEALRTKIDAARDRLPRVIVPDALLSELVAAASAYGVDSLRPCLLAVNAARANAALEGRMEAIEDDALVAARFVLAPRACALPPSAETPEESPQDGDVAHNEPPSSPDPPPPHEDSAPNPEKASAQSLGDRIQDAVRTAIPANLLTQLADGLLDRRARGPQGKGGLGARSKRHGRPAGVRPGDLRGGARLALLDTLRTAAPRQALRRRERMEPAAAAPMIQVRQEDFRVRIYKPRSLVATIFVVDASGSAALHRLAEAKGAVLALLAQCYVRRDEVGLIAFRGNGADLLLPPTRSLTRVRRQLAQLPGGGGTPLASGIALAGEAAAQAAKRGARPALVFLTDGQANVGLNGAGGRAGADADVERTAKMLKARGFSTMVIDTSARPGPQARKLAERLGARYMPLPAADASRLARAVIANTV